MKIGNKLTSEAIDAVEAFYQKSESLFIHHHEPGKKDFVRFFKFCGLLINSTFG